MLRSGLKGVRDDTKTAQHSTPDDVEGIGSVTALVGFNDVVTVVKELKGNTDR
jgi:hypothetical protein